jgi:Protein of unknown function (DUF2949)
MSQHDISKFVDFLHQELSISQASIDLGIKLAQPHHGSFPMILWQYGLVSLEQFDRIYDWLESYNISSCQ